MTFTDYFDLLDGYKQTRTLRRQESVWDAVCIARMLGAAGTEDWEDTQKDLFRLTQPQPDYESEALKAGLHPPEE